MAALATAALVKPTQGYVLFVYFLLAPAFCALLATLLIVSTALWIRAAARGNMAAPRLATIIFAGLLLGDSVLSVALFGEHIGLRPLANEINAHRDRRTLALESELHYPGDSFQRYDKQVELPANALSQLQSLRTKSEVTALLGEDFVSRASFRYPQLVTLAGQDHRFDEVLHYRLSSKPGARLRQGAANKTKSFDGVFFLRNSKVLGVVTETVPAAQAAGAHTNYDPILLYEAAYCRSRTTSAFQDAWNFSRCATAAFQACRPA